MDLSIARKAASKFGSGEPEIHPFGTGLINHSFKVSFPDGITILLQCINQATFSQPENIIHNYQLLYDYLAAAGHKNIPALAITSRGKYFWVDEDENFWRATGFVSGSYANSTAGSDDEVKLAAKCFAAFTTALNGLDPEKLEIIIPGFHDLSLRYQQFEKAITGAAINRLLKATHVISSLRERVHLVRLYESIVADEKNYPVRIMHHDCKISNILFDSESGNVICPVDLDTVMPGRFFSDLGDMIRTMACSREENSTEWENIDIVPSYYQAIMNGYLEGSGDLFTEAEKSKMDYAGLMLMYMQCLRFVTDFLNNDIYYKTSYPEQNLNRALNQLILLEKLEEYTRLTS